MEAVCCTCHLISPQVFSEPYPDQCQGDVRLRDMHGKHGKQAEHGKLAAPFDCPSITHHCPSAWHQGQCMTWTSSQQVPAGHQCSQHHACLQPCGLHLHKGGMGMSHHQVHGPHARHKGGEHARHKGGSELAMFCLLPHASHACPAASHLLGIDQGMVH